MNVDDYYGITVSDLVAADEERELRSQCAAERMAHAKRMARKSPFTHPDARTPDEPESDDGQ
jgi:hypothetical protein